MAKNKTGKPALPPASPTGRAARYFKYAIEEIILVVIGILIALQINNWNEQRKDRTKEQTLLVQLLEDYKAKLLQLDEKMATRERIILSGMSLLEAFDYPERANRDSVIKKLAVIGHDPTFDPILNDLSSYENLRLIRHEKLRRLLSNWTSEIVSVKEIATIWSEIVYSQYDLAATEMGIGRDLANSFWNQQDHLWLLDGNSDGHKVALGTSRLGASLNELLNSRQLETIASNAIICNKSANRQSEALRKTIKEILTIITT